MKPPGLRQGVMVMVFIVALLLAGCDAVRTATGLGPAIEGSGTEATESRDVRGFSSVLVKGNGSLVLEQTGEESLSITADDNILPLLESTVENGRLTLGPQNDTSVDADTPIVYRLTVRELDSLEVEGNIFATGSELNSERLEVRGNGNSSVALSGNADYQAITMGGNHTFDGAELTGTEANVECTGNGSTTVNVSDSLQTETHGNCHILYLGSPQVTPGGTENVSQQK